MAKVAIMPFEMPPLSPRESLVCHTIDTVAQENGREITTRSADREPSLSGVCARDVCVCSVVCVVCVLCSVFALFCVYMCVLVHSTAYRHRRVYRIYNIYNCLYTLYTAMTHPSRWFASKASTPSPCVDAVLLTRAPFSTGPHHCTSRGPDSANLHPCPVPNPVDRVSAFAPAETLRSVKIPQDQAEATVGKER